MKTQSHVSKEILAEVLTPEQYHVTQEAGTEPPFRNKYAYHFEPGIYVDIISGEPLFASVHKYDSGSGWPSFTQPIFEKAITQHHDTSLVIPRTEVKSQSSGAHLGHVFTDGPVSQGGLRYCINSAALQFIPLDQLRDTRYGRYIDLLSK